MGSICKGPKSAVHFTTLALPCLSLSVVVDGYIEDIVCYPEYHYFTFSNDDFSIVIAAKFSYFQNSRNTMLTVTVL